MSPVLAIRPTLRAVLLFAALLPLVWLALSYRPQGWPRAFVGKDAGATMSPVLAIRPTRRMLLLFAALLPLVSSRSATALSGGPAPSLERTPAPR